MSATDKIARVAGAQQLPSQPLVDVLERFDARGLRELSLGVDHTFSWLGVRCLLPDGAARASVLDYLAETGSAAARVLAREAGAAFVELRVTADARVCASVHSVGRREIANDTELVRELSELDADSHVLLVALARELSAAGGESDGVSRGADGVASLRVVLANDSEAQLTRTLGAIDAVATGLQASLAQRALLRSSHRSLSRSGPCMAVLSVQNKRLMMGVGIEYAPLSWDSGTQLMAGLHPGTSAHEKLRVIADSCGSDQVSRLRLELGASEPPGLQVWAELAAVDSGVRSVE